MPEFVIERNMPGAGALTGAQLHEASRTSCSVLRDLDHVVQWVHSYVTPDKLYCIYRAPSEDLIRRHAEQAGFPADSIARVVTVIDPVTAE